MASIRTARSISVMRRAPGGISVEGSFRAADTAFSLSTPAITDASPDISMSLHKFVEEDLTSKKLTT